MSTLRLELTQHLALRPLPQLVASAALLELTSDEVDAVVEQELDVNPALERTGPGRPLPALAELGDVAAPREARELLAAEARAALAPSEHRIVDHVVASLDARGFLRDGEEELARDLGVAPDRVRRAVAAVRAAAPAGVAARDVRECLLLQLEEWEESPLRRLLQAVVARHLADLARGRTAAIASALGVREEEVNAAAETLRRRLRPYPVDESEHWERRPPAPAVDVVVCPRGGRLAVDIVGSPQLRVRDEGSDRDRVHARELVERLERRRRTLERVSEIAVRRQQSFVCGVGPLQPLTHSQVAEEVGVHPSTVSRAVANRFVRLPSGRVVPLEGLFCRRNDAAAALADVIRDERTPLSDSALSRELERRGHCVARRTVAKYRAVLGIPPHHERRAKRVSR